MFETMDGADGVGLAAPQIGQAIRLFVVNYDKGEDENDPGFKRVIINPEVIGEGDEVWPFEEGCLSIPGIREKVERTEEIRVRYLDENFEVKEETLNGLPARVFLHELDHLDGVLFTDHLGPLKKTLLRNKLNDIAAGGGQAHYPTLRYNAPKRKK